MSYFPEMLTFPEPFYINGVFQTTEMLAYIHATDLICSIAAFYIKLIPEETREGTRRDQKGPEWTRNDQNGPERIRDQNGPERTIREQKGAEGSRGDQKGPKGTRRD
jgi:hypothetical protein